MASSTKRALLFLAHATVIVLGSAVVGVSPAWSVSHQPGLAHGVSGDAHPNVVSAVGIYDYFDGNVIVEGGAAATITINANGTWTLMYSSITDAGVWVQQGRALALTVTSGEDGSAGCLLLGTVQRRGINSATNQGPINCSNPFGKTGTWYATVPPHVR